MYGYVKFDSVHVPNKKYLINTNMILYLFSFFVKYHTDMQSNS